MALNNLPAMSKLEFELLEISTKAKQELNKNPYEQALCVEELDDIFKANNLPEFLQENGLTQKGLDAWKIRRDEEYDSTYNRYVEFRNYLKTKDRFNS